MAAPAGDSESPKPLSNETAPAKTGAVEKLVLRPRGPAAPTTPAASPSVSATLKEVPSKSVPTGTPANSTPAPELKKIGRYAIVKKIGQGGMGAVYLATDTQLKRQVALKVLPKEKAENPILVRRFQAEATAAAQLKHDHIVGIHDAGEADGLLYIALEFIEGTDAHSMVGKRGPMAPKRAMEVIRQIASALQHAHEQKIVHRDIKPSNILIRKDGVAKLTDMGLARSIDESMETNITRAGTTVGTVDYMAPEQARSSKAADIRSDLYSLGATWFHLLAGHAPFHEGSMLNKLNAHSSKPRPDVRDVNPNATEEMAVMIQRLMAIKPDDRYQTPQELLDDLDNENLNRGPVSLQDLAALARDDDSDDQTRAHDEPKASYKKPAAQESKQLMAPTLELPTLSSSRSPATMIPKSRLDPELIKKLIVGAVVIIALGVAGSVISRLGNSVSTPTTPGVNPFERDIASTEGTAPTVIKNNDAKPAEPERNRPRPIGSASKGPKPLNPKNASDAGTTNAAARPTVPTGSLFVPPITPLGRDGEVRHIPEWISETGSLLPSGLTTISVGAGPSGFEQVPTLREALLKLPEAGGIVELPTEGPHFLTPLELVNRATVIIRAAKGVQPLIVLVAEPDQPYDSLLKVTNGSLTLEGLQFLSFARQFANDNPLQLVAVRSGDLAAVRCTFTQLGSRRGRTFAVGTEGKVTRSETTIPPVSRLLLRECLVRGSALGGFAIDQPTTDLVASRCVFATGSAPVLTLTNHDPVEDEPAKPANAPTKTGGSKVTSKSPVTKALKPATSAARQLRFLSCGLVSGGTAFELSPGANPQSPPLTEVTIVNCAAGGVTLPQSSSVLLHLPRWPRNVLGSETQNAYANLGWTIESSLICGWKKLIQDEPGSNSSVATGAEWKEMWRQQMSLDESQFLASGWPQTAPRDFTRITTADLPLPTDVGVSGSDGQPPGCLLNELQEPSPLTLARADALADRAGYPITGLEPFAANKTLRIDGSTQDVGRILNTDNWPSGTHVIVTGSGQADITPVEFKGKSLRIEFQSGSTPLVLRPRKSSKAKDEAIFVVEGGSLEIIGGHFRFPNTSTEALPQYFLSVHDGNFALRDCEVIGQTLDSTSQFSGLINWKRAQVERKEFNIPNERNSGVIVNSRLLTSGKLLDADMRRRTLILRNSLFASMGELFDLSIHGFQAHIGGTIDARWCTFGAGGKYLFQVRGTKGAERTTHPLNVFVEHSVLVPLTALSGAANPPVLLSAPEHVLANQQVAWWDISNGYAASWPQLVRAADTPAKSAQAFDVDWKSRWGEGHILRPLVNAEDVRFASAWPARTKITPQDFQLDPNCPAATWGPRDTPLGVAFTPWRNSSSSTARPQPTNDDGKKSNPAGIKKPDF